MYSATFLFSLHCSLPGTENHFHANNQHFLKFLNFVLEIKSALWNDMIISIFYLLYWFNKFKRCVIVILFFYRHFWGRETHCTLLTVCTHTSINAEKCRYAHIHQCICVYIVFMYELWRICTYKDFLKFTNKWD